MKKYKENEQTREQFFEEQRKVKKPAGGAGAASAGVVSNKVIEVLPADASGNEVVPESAPAPVASSSVPASADHSSLFDAPGDLALQRRLERQNTSDA